MSLIITRIKNCKNHIPKGSMKKHQIKYLQYENNELK
jgi:hypothetical protein